MKKEDDIILFSKKRAVREENGFLACFVGIYEGDS